jgi:hypothetical protein
MNTGSKESLGASNTVDGAEESAAKLNDILGRTVGQSTLGIGPHEFVGVELWGIGGKPMHMQPLVLAQKLLDDDAPVDGATIPKQYNRSEQVPEKMAQESDDLHTGNVGAVETEVKSKPLPQRGDSDGRDRRNPIPFVAVSEDGCPPDGCPGLADVRDEEEPAFVEEYQMGPKSSSFFLYAATPLSSSGRWLARLSVWPDVPAFGTSIGDPSSPATHGPGGNESRSASRSAWQSAVGSTGLSCILLRGRLFPAIAQARASGTGKAAADGQVLAWAGERLPHLGESSGPNAPQSLSRRLESRLRTDTSCRLAADLRLDVFVLPAAEGFHGVSCPIA